MKDSIATRVLVVEDDGLMRWAIAETLQDTGCTVLKAGDCASAIREFANAPPVDAVVLDLRLPDSQGLWLLNVIRQLSPRSRIIVITAYDTPELAAQARDLGACDVLGKPFDLHHLVRSSPPPPRRRARQICEGRGLPDLGRRPVQRPQHVRPPVGRRR